MYQYLLIAVIGLFFAPSHFFPSENPDYSFQMGTPAALPNFIDTDAGCNWMGVGGQVFSDVGELVEKDVMKKAEKESEGEGEEEN